MQTLTWLEIVSLLGLGSALLTAVGSVLKWWFDHRTRKTEAFMKTFERFSDLTAKFYMPMAVLGGRVARLFAQLDEPKPPEHKFAFFILSRFHMRVLQYMVEGGGYLMRDWLDDRIQGRFYLRAGKLMPFSDTDISVMQHIAEKCDNYLFFKYILDKSSPTIKAEVQLQQIYPRFEKWVQKEPEKVKAVARILRCYSQNLLLIINKMYGSWFRRPILTRTPTPVSNPCRDAISRLRKQIKAEQRESARKGEEILEEIQ